MKTNYSFLSQAPLLIWILLLWSAGAQAAERHYRLEIAKQDVNFTGESVPAMTINGGIPGPTLSFTEGDHAVIEVTNTMDVSTSIHWHGMLVPPEMDGVPGISFGGIEPRSTKTYRFPILQSGTYWYHSHTGLQEQLGVYGSIAIRSRKSEPASDQEKVVMLSDWTNRSPGKVMKLLRRGSEWMGVQKGSAQSLLGAVKTGKFIEFWKREAMRMPAMDVADVAYDAFLTNGKIEDALSAKPGETVRLRIIDGSSTTFFHLQYAGGPLRIVAADGQRVEPLILKKPLLIGVAETYDVLVTVPRSGAWEFRATAHDGSGHTSLWIGQGGRHGAPDMPKPFLYDTMDMFSWKNLFAPTPAGTMGMPNREVDAGKFDQPGMNMNMGAGMMDMSMGQDMEMKLPTKRDGRKDTKMSGMDHGAMGGMDMSGMDMGGMDMGGMDHHAHQMTMPETPDPAMGMKMNSGDDGSHAMHGMDGAGLKQNPGRWYDFLLRGDSAASPLMASDSMMSEDRPFSPYKELRALKSTAPPADAPRRTVRLTLDGDMKRYVWMLNNRALAPNNDIHIKEGEVVRFIFINRTMMHHPMHLHGHFFRVINGQGGRSPLKHTVDVPPMMTTVIEFEADEVGDWFFHCHLLYHMHSGMARVVEYEGFTPTAEAQAARAALYHDPWYFYGFSDMLSNETQGSLWYSNIRNTLGMNYELGWQGVDDAEWETDVTYSRYLNRFTSVFAVVYGEGINGHLEQDRIIGGFSYLLPGNIRSKVWADSDGGARVTIGRELMLTPRLGIFGEVEYDTHDDWSYQGGASWLIHQAVSVTALWDSKYGVGAGLTIRF